MRIHHIVLDCFPLYVELHSPIDKLILMLWNYITCLDKNISLTTLVIQRIPLLISALRIQISYLVPYSFKNSRFFSLCINYDNVVHLFSIAVNQEQDNIWLNVKDLRPLKHYSPSGIMDLGRRLWRISLRYSS